MILDRRGFLRAAGAAGLAGLGGRLRFGAMRLGFVASGDDAVHVFGAGGAEWWSLLGRIETRAPRALGLSRDRRMLYVGNAVEEFGGRPTGSVEAYAVDWETGALRLVNRAGLALFATRPESLAVSPNGRWLAVGLGGRGCNLLSLGEDGALGGVTASLRRIGGQAAEGGVRVEFVDDATLVGMEGSVMAVGEDGSLGLCKGGAGRGFPRACELVPGLVAAAAKVGIEEPHAMIVG